MITQNYCQINVNEYHCVDTSLSRKGQYQLSQKLSQFMAYVL